MKKPKVILLTFSPKLEDGSRKTINTQTICTCNEQGTAQLICRLLKENAYKTLLNDYSDNTQQFHLIVEN